MLAGTQPDAPPSAEAPLYVWLTSSWLSAVRTCAGAAGYPVRAWHGACAVQRASVQAVQPAPHSAAPPYAKSRHT